MPFHFHFHSHFPVPLPSSLFDLHSLCPDVCASIPRRWAVSVSVSSMPLSTPTAADLLSPKSSELSHMILFLFMLSFLFFLFLFWFWFCFSFFFYICSNAPKLKVNSAVLLHHKLLYLPLPLFVAATTANNSTMPPSKQKLTTISISRSVVVVVVFFKGAFLYGSSVFRFVCALPVCACVCVCVVKICFFLLYLKIGSIFVVCAFLVRLQQVSGVWVRAWAWARALRPSLSDAAGLALR